MHRYRAAAHQAAQRALAGAAVADNKGVSDASHMREGGDCARTYERSEGNNGVKEIIAPEAAELSAAELSAAELSAAELPAPRAGAEVDRMVTKESTKSESAGLVVGLAAECEAAVVRQGADAPQQERGEGGGSRLSSLQAMSIGRDFAREITSIQKVHNFALCRSSPPHPPFPPTPHNALKLRGRACARR